MPGGNFGLDLLACGINLTHLRHTGQIHELRRYTQMAILAKYTIVKWEFEQAKVSRKAFSDVIP